MAVRWTLLLLGTVCAQQQAETGSCSQDSEQCKSADMHPSRSFGGGCRPFMETGGEYAWDELIDVRSLPKKAKVFVCFDSRGQPSDPSKRGKLKLQPAIGGVVLVENFLSNADIQHMRGLLDNWVVDSEDQGGWRFAYGVGSQFKDNLDMESARQQHAATYSAFEDRVLNRIESRVSRFLRIPATLFENYLQLMEETGSRRSALHHDKNHALVRRATALVYLNGNDSEQHEDALVGGETLFPALPRWASDREHILTPDSEHRALSEQLESIVSNTIKSLDATDAWPELQSISGDKLHSEAMRLCAKAATQTAFDGDNGYGPLLAVAPVQGRALFWWHEGPMAYNLTESGPEGDILGNMWHIGCPVQQGKKLSLQKFKNYGPDSDACKRLKWCTESWRRLLGDQMQGHET